MSTQTRRSTCASIHQRGDIFTLNGSSQKLVDKFTNLGSSVLSNETDINTQLAKTWTAYNRLSVIWMSHLTDKSMSILLYGWTSWKLTKRMEKKLDINYTRILNKSWRQCPIKQLLYVHLPPITKTIQVRRIRHAGHCWRSRNELICDILQWTPSHGRVKASWNLYTTALCCYRM